MENVTDYSTYVTAAYLFAGVALGTLFAVSLFQYYRAKSQLKGKNEK